MGKRTFLLVLLLALLLVSCSGPESSGDKDRDIDAVTQETDAQESAIQESGEEKDPAQPYINPDLDYLVLVDSRHPLPEGWEESIETEHFTNAVGDEVVVERTAYEAYLKLKDKLESEGVYVDLDSAYRSVEEQQKIVDEFTEEYGAAYASTYAATPGCSEHHTGLALDLFLIVDGDIIYKNEDMMNYPEIWETIHSEMADYGFILRYPGGRGYAYEPWHIRYVGVDAAKEITEKGLMLEDYLGE